MLINMSWNTSMEIGVRIESEHPLTGERLHCCSAYLTFVAIESQQSSSLLSSTSHTLGSGFVLPDPHRH